MNLNGDEKRIQQLFREMSRHDELRMPAFSRVVEGGSLRVAPFRAGVSRKLAWTFAALCVAVITLAVVTLRHQSPVVRDDQAKAEEQPSESSPIPIPLAGVIQPRDLPPVRPAVKAVFKPVRHRKPVNDLALAMKLSTWRSPTASLLKTTSDDKLMSLPKLGESLQTLRFYSLDDLN
jgi:hypothetical protein